MATPEDQSVGRALASLENLSVWQIFILGLWVFCSLLHRLAGSAKEFLKRCFLAASDESRPRSSHGTLEVAFVAESTAASSQIDAAPLSWTLGRVPILQRLRPQLRLLL